MLTLIQCFSQMTRSIGNRITADNVKQVFEILINQAKYVIETNQSIELDNEISEASLFAIENLIRKTHKEIDKDMLT